jgi:CheY-like chemotaxis protein
VIAEGQLKVGGIFSDANNASRNTRDAAQGWETKIGRSRGEVSLGGVRALRGLVNRGGVLAGRVILVVEDEVLIALDVKDALESADAQVLVANSLKDGLRLAKCSRISAAILDISFGPRDCKGVCWRLSKRAVPFMFHTGYLDSRVLRRWPNAPLVNKPALREQIVARVVDLMR